jgi:nitrite reductase (NO-forming)
MTKSIFLFIICFSACYTVSFAQKESLKESISRGQDVYLSNCMTCHMENGEGVEGTFPPLVKTDFVTGDTKKLIGIILKGQSGEITVNGKTYNMEMPSQSHLSDDEIADVSNYIRNSWDNKAKKAVTPAEVKASRN